MPAHKKLADDAPAASVLAIGRGARIMMMSRTTNMTGHFPTTCDSV